MAIDPWGLVGGSLGAVGGAIANDSRIDDARRQKRLLQMQQNSYRRRKGYTSRILAGQLSIDALSATHESKSAAIEAFQNESKLESNVAQSGVSGGTPVYQLNRYIADSANSLAEQFDLAQKKLALESLNGEAQLSSIDDSIAMIGEQIKDIDKSIDYYSSPFGYIMSSLTGALSGAKLGLGLEAMKVSMFGVPQADDTAAGDAVESADEAEAASRRAIEARARSDSLSGGARIGDGFGVNKYGYDTLRIGESVITYGKQITPVLDFGSLSVKNDPLATGLKGFGLYGNLLAINPLDVKKKPWSGFKTFSFAEPM